MNIEIGKYYINKTWRFLLPALRGHGDLFVKKFNPLFKLAVGIHDTLIDDSNESKSRNICIMVNKTVQPHLFISFLEWVRTEPYYVCDYCPDSELETSKKHMVIVEIPKMFNKAYDMFLQGNYSKMYTEEEIHLLFPETMRIDKDVLLKKPCQREKFIKILNKEFDTNIQEVETDEYELPLKKVEEIFNCNNEEYSVFFGGEDVAIWNYECKLIEI